MTDEKDKNPLKRTAPPKNNDEWAHIFEGVDKAHKGWLVTGPIHAVVSNWKALVVILGIFTWFNIPKLSAVLAIITGAVK